MLTEDGAFDLEVPRDRQGRLEPQLVEKYARRLPGFDDKVISMYARGMTTREIRAQIAELYGLAVSAELISKVTDAVLDEVAEWQSHPLEEVYAIVYFDAVRVKIRDEGLVRNKAVYLAIGVSCAGRKEVLGLWIEQTEGAKFWLSVMNELKARGVGDVLIAAVDGLKGFPRRSRRCFPGDGPDLLGAPHPALAGLCVVQGAPGTGRGTQHHLPGADRGRGTGRPGGPGGRCVGSDVPGLELIRFRGHPDTVLRRCSQWQRPTHRTRRSTGSSWSSWPERVARRGSYGVLSSFVPGDDSDALRATSSETVARRPARRNARRCSSVESGGWRKRPRTRWSASTNRAGHRLQRRARNASGCSASQSVRGERGRGEVLQSSR